MQGGPVCQPTCSGVAACAMDHAVQRRTGNSYGSHQKIHVLGFRQSRARRGLIVPRVWTPLLRPSDFHLILIPALDTAIMGPRAAALVVPTARGHAKLLTCIDHSYRLGAESMARCK